jgi:UDP-N-acetylmuramoyl-tripeptide--D-alanyl-D-alanine ligase
MKLSEIAEIADGKLLGSDVEVKSFSTDSRSIKVGQAFVALRGENFDAHDFIREVLDKGAIAAIVDEKLNCENFSDANLIVVKDTLQAYGRIASFSAQGYAAKRVAITGSCGKTSVKEMLNSILSEAGSVLATKGNLNNEIGVPKTLLEIDDSHDFAVIEMGANHKGEIAYLSKLVNADIVSVLNADRAHLEGFGSVEGVAHAKGEIFSGAKSGALAILSLDEKYFDLWKSLCEQHGLSLFTCSLANPDADVCLLEKRMFENGNEITLKLFEDTFIFKVPMLGEHNVKNALIAITIAKKLGLTNEQIASGLEKVEAAKGRLRTLSLNEGNTLVDDSYNANPLSVKAAIDVLSEFSKRKVLILGDMAELGEQAEKMHGEIGEYAKERKLDVLLACGVLSKAAVENFSGTGAFYETQEKLIEALPEWYEDSRDSVYLVKGSRSAAMEKVVESLQALGEAA